MKASQIVEQARSLADLQNSKAISYDDEKNSINTAYKLIYNNISESDDDFYLVDFTYNSISSYQTSIPFNYELPLPVDFYKLRTVNYNYNGSWYPMSRMPLNLRNVNTSEPHYRIKNNNLWIVSGSQTQVGSVSIGYYPPPAVITIPDYSTTFDLKIPLAQEVSKYHCISDENTLYKCVGNTIVYYTQNKTTSTLVYTGASATSYPVYYKGLLYFYEGTSLSYIDITIGTATVLKTSLSVVPYTVRNNIIYYTDGIDTFQNSFLGSSETLLFTGKVATNVYNLASASYAYLEAGIYYQDLVVIDSNVSYLNYPFYNKLDNVYTSPSTIWKENVNIGAEWNNRIIAKSSLDSTIYTYSTIVDTDLSYPTNAFFEILAYQSASDFKRKYEESSVDLDNKLSQMWNSFLSSMIRRDEYKTEKIQNVYNTGISFGNF